MFYINIRTPIKESTQFYKIYVSNLVYTDRWMWICKRERVVFFYIFIIKLKMASYTSEQLRLGTPTEELIGNKTFTLTNPSTGSAYFTIETVADSTGSYFTQPTNARGVYSNFTSINEDSLVTSSYIASVVVPEGQSSFQFNSTVDVAISSSKLRATGGTSLVIS